MIDRKYVLPHLLAARAEQNPDRVFLEHSAGDVQTYGELDLVTRRWAALLRSLGVGTGDTLLVMIPSSFRSVQLWMACGWLRALEVPVNTDYRGTMLAHIVNDSLSTSMVVAAQFVDRVASVQDRLVHLRLVVVTDWPAHEELPDLGPIHVERAEDLLAAVEPALGLNGPDAHDAAGIIYTSGTTGPSKGVVVSWAQRYATTRAAWPEHLLDDTDVFYHPFPMNHVAGKGPIMLEALLNGRVVIKEGFKTAEFWDDVRRFGCTTANLVGAMALFLHRQPPREDDATSPLRQVMVTPLFPEIEDFKRRFGVRVRSCFNMTEISTPLSVDGFDLNGTSCGRVRSGVEVRLVDEADHEVPVGEVGELVVRNAEPWTLMLGYWNDPAATVAAWRNQWMHTGDAFRRDEHGNHYFVDRMKDALRRRGENISSLELEAEIDSHDAVLESAVVGVPSEFGEDEILAFVVLRPGACCGEAEVERFLVERVPGFMVPRYLEIVAELPKTATQRTRKHLLRERGVGPATWERPSREARR